ncbi:GntR family transcriptional regulator [Nocardia amikacinitolerans]|uniref:GntR family transcriptional regulator n=1 Tax=Nocardia amikacinitolerans TaxID=756689 RepID=UPI0020A44453|nr:GntR family transcriptional regulator [Nocardia amikacinitolerans]MCP2288333.1 DNA-binding transcriptional regulator, GntR family [Nocardia amikacinitolerans]
MDLTVHGLPRGANKQRQQLSEDVAGYVRELIISGRVRAGDFLRIEPIAEAVGVSNTPVREGLLLLSGEGFIELVPRRGFMVSAFSRQDVRDLFWAQATLAGELAGRAAKSISAPQLDHLGSVLAAHEQAVAEGADADRVVALGHEFHRTVNRAADSNRLALLLGAIVKQLPNRFYNEIEGHGEQALLDHPAILEALRKRRAKAASTLMRDHIMSGADGLVAMLEKQGLWSDEERKSTA